MPNENEEKQQFQCPRCGSEQYSIQHAGGLTTTFLLCKKCGNQGTPQAWQTAMEMGDSFMMGAESEKVVKEAEPLGGIGGTDKMPSSQVPENHKVPRKMTQEKRKKNEKRLMPDDPERSGPHQNLEAGKMGFNLKKVQSNKLKPYNLKKLARDFRWTEEQLHRNLELGKNMVFPEGDQSDDKVDIGAVGENDTRRFDTIDRKDMHRSPDPKAIQPGYKEWYEREVDKYYDGWLDDHIENSGGKVVGSNTEKMMNLDDGERYHAPEYPREAIYEKLLESRHEFDDDYVRVVASTGEERVFTKTAYLQETGIDEKQWDKLKEASEVDSDCEACKQFGATCPDCANKRTEKEKEDLKKKE